MAGGEEQKKSKASSEGRKTLNCVEFELLPVSIMEKCGAPKQQEKRVKK